MRSLGSGGGSLARAVDRPEERGQGLARAGRGQDQGVVAVGDGLPAPRSGQAWARRRRPRTSRERWRRTGGGSPAHRTGNHRLAGSRPGSAPPVGCIRCRAHVRRAMFLGVVVLVAVAAPGAARAQSATPSPTTAPGPTVTGAQDQVMLSGSVLVPRGLTVGEVVVFHGRAVVLGVSLGDVVVLDGPVTIAGQVSGSVIALNGPIRLAATASVRGDVLGAETVKVEQGATIGGRHASGRRVHASRVVVGAGRLARRRRDRLLDPGARPAAVVAGAAWSRPGGERRAFGAVGLRRVGDRAGDRPAAPGRARGGHDPRAPARVVAAARLGVRVPGGGDVVHLVGGPRAGPRTAIAVARLPGRVGDRARGEPGALPQRGRVDRRVDLRARRHDGGGVAGPGHRRTPPLRLRRDPRDRTRAAATGTAAPRANPPSPRRTSPAACAGARSPHPPPHPRPAPAGCSSAPWRPVRS